VARNNQAEDNSQTSPMLLPKRKKVGLSFFSKNQGGFSDEEDKESRKSVQKATPIDSKTTSKS